MSGQKRRIRAIAVTLVAAGIAVGCGGSEESGDPPAAGPLTPPAGTPGVPAGAAYDVDGRRWLRLAKREQFAAAAAYIADNPERCRGADVGAVSVYATTSIGTDFPLLAPAADALAEGCDAELQS